MQHWINKFQVAFHGIALGVRGQSSFAIHLVMSSAVVVLATLLGCSVWQWCLLLLSIGLVVSAELINSAIEHLARGLCPDRNQQVGNALDIASGAVLVASLISATVGLIIFSYRLLQILGE